MSEASIEQIAAAGGFLAVECCGERVGFTNPTPFTPGAAARFEVIRQRHVTGDDPLGNGWADDAEAKALLADPAAYGPPEDGTRLPFSCPSCGTSFVWFAGHVLGVPRQLA